MTHNKVTLALASILITAALYPAGAAGEEDHTPAESAAIERVRAEWRKAGIAEKEISEKEWMIGPPVGMDRLFEENELTDENGRPGIIVRPWPLDSAWVVFEDEIMRLDNRSGKYTPHLPLYFVEHESAYDPANPGPDIIGDAVKLPRDPEGPYDFVTARWPIYMHAAPSQYYRAEPLSAVAVVPGNVELPILAWTCTFVDWYYYEGCSQQELWIRTQYDGMKGWVCAWEERDWYRHLTYVDLSADSMFKMKVAVDELKFESAPDTLWLEKGEELSFFYAKPGTWNQLRGGIPDWALYLSADVEYKGIPGFVRLGYFEPDMNENGKGGGPVAAGWSVEIDPRFLELNCEYNYRDGDFPYVAPLSKEIPDKASTIFYVDGSWAALGLFTPLGGGKPNDWFYVGTKEDPRFCIFEFVDRSHDIEYVTAGDGAYRPPRIEWLFRRGLWPDARAYYVDVLLFEELWDAGLSLDTITASQPAGGASCDIEFEAAYPNAQPNYGDKTLTYRFEFPDGIDPARPYRLDLTLRWPEEGRDLLFSYNPAEE